MKELAVAVFCVVLTEPVSACWRWVFRRTDRRNKYEIKEERFESPSLAEENQPVLEEEIKP